ncbi:hypothetical protein Tco_1047241 [Tanacetum coccineum]
MTVVRFHCPFVGLSGCHDGGGNGLTKTSLITHLRDRHCNGEAQAITKHSLLSNLVIFERAEVTLKRMGIWVAYCQIHPPKCRLGFSRVLKGAFDKVICKPYDISCWVCLLALPLCLLKTFRPRSNLECKSAIKRQCQEESIVNAIRSWGTPGGSLQLLKETLVESSPTFLDVNDDDLDLGEQNIKQCKRKICGGHYTAAVRVLSSSDVAPYNEATLKDLKTKHPFHPTPFLPHISTDHHHLITSSTVVLDRIKSFPRGTSCGRDGLRAQHLMDCLSGAAVAVSDELISSITQVVNLFLAGSYPQMLGEYIASAPLTPLVKPGGGIRPIAMGIVWRGLVSKVSAIMIGHSLDGYLDGLQFGVRVVGESETILHFVNRLIEAFGGDVGLSMLLVDFKNAFNLVDREVMLREVRLHCPAISRWCYTPLICKIRDSFSLSLHAWYLDDGTIVGDTVVVGKVLELIMEDGPRCGLQLNVDKTKVFWPKEDPRSRLTSIFPPNIARSLHGVKLLGGPASVDFDFCNELVMKRVAKTIGLMDAIAKINDPQCKFVLLTWLFVLLWSVLSLLRDQDLVTGNGDLLPYLLHFFWGGGGGGLGVYSAGDVLNYAFLASQLQSTDLQTKLLRRTSIVSPGLIFDDALSVFNTSIEIDLFCNPSEITATKLMKKMADIYFTRVTKNAKSTFSLSSRQMALWTSQREDHTSDWLTTVSISGLEQTMNGKTYRCVLCYRLGIPLFSGSKRCSACSRVFTGDIYGDHAVSCAGIIDIKHCHNVVRDTLVDICYRSGISAGKEVDIGLDGGRDKPLRPADILLYSWDGGLDVCVDLTGSSPLTQTEMVDFVPGRAVIVAA